MSSCPSGAASGARAFRRECMSHSLWLETRRVMIGIYRISLVLLAMYTKDTMYLDALDRQAMQLLHVALLQIRPWPSGRRTIRLSSVYEVDQRGI